MSLENLWDPYCAKPWTTSREAWIFLFTTLGRESDMVQLSWLTAMGWAEGTTALSLFFYTIKRSKLQKSWKNTTMNFCISFTKIHQLLTVCYICLTLCHRLSTFQFVCFLVIRFGLTFLVGAHVGDEWLFLLHIRRHDGATGPLGDATWITWLGQCLWSCFCFKAENFGFLLLFVCLSVCFLTENFGRNLSLTFGNSW